MLSIATFFFLLTATPHVVAVARLIITAGLFVSLLALFALALAVSTGFRLLQ